MANRYFIGQGTVSVALRNANGTPQTFRSLGNCPNLELSVDEEFVEHYESESGFRRLDLMIRTRLQVTFNFAVENFNLDNWLMVYNGTIGSGAADEDVIYAFNADPVDLWVKFAGMNLAEQRNPVTLNIFRARLQTPGGFAFIGEDVAKVDLTGFAQYDALNSDKGGLFTITQKKAT